MKLQRIERRAFQPRTDRFVCVHCGLVDKLVRPGRSRHLLAS